MPLKFDGGQRFQRGRGIGGIFRFLKSIFSPFVKTIGKTAVKAIKSDTGKLIANRVKDQAIESALNLTSNALRGNDLNTSVHSELNQIKEKTADTIDKIGLSRKRKNPIIGSGISSKNQKKYLSQILKIDPKELMNKYSEDDSFIRNKKRKYNSKSKKKTIF